MESYTDNPALDDTPRANPAFWRGKANGIDAVLKIVHDVMAGNDNGSGVNNHEQLEKMRRALISWRDQLDVKESKSK
jgi:hypothetical protein